MENLGVEGLGRLGVKVSSLRFKFCGLGIQRFRDESLRL